MLQWILDYVVAHLTFYHIFVNIMMFIFVRKLLGYILHLYINSIYNKKIWEVVMRR